MLAASRGFDDPRVLVDELERLEQGAARLGQRLYDLDEAASTGLLAETGAWRGRTAALVGEATSALAALWPGWAALRDRLAEARDAADRKDWARLSDLLDTPVTDVATDTAGHVRPGELGPLLGGRIDDVRTRAAAIEAALRQHAPRATDLQQRLDGMLARAVAIGVEDDTEVHEAREAVAHLTSLVAGDPLHDQLEREALAAAEEVEQAYALVTTLEAQRDGLGTTLVRATATTTELAALVEQGRDALARARDRILAPEGLLAPLDPALLDEPPMGLVPWLERLRATADDGRWRAATIGLHRWQQVADVHLEHARRVAAANAAPVARRDELRGLLAGLRSRAAADGRVEEPELARLHEAADAVLRVAPCDLEAADPAVEAYRRAVLLPTGAR